MKVWLLGNTGRSVKVGLSRFRILFIFVMFIQLALNYFFVDNLVLDNVEPFYWPPQDHSDTTFFFKGFAWKFERRENFRGRRVNGKIDKRIDFLKYNFL